MRQAGAVFAVVIAVLASTALSGGQSALPAKDELLGGGTMGPHFVSNRRLGHPDVRYTTIRVDKQTGKTIHLYGEWPVPCSNRAPVTAIFDAVVPLKTDGSFAGTGVLPKTAVIPKGLHYGFSGAFDSPTAAHVVGSARFTFAGDGKTSSCSGNGIRTQVRSPGNVEGRAAPKASAVYYGSTSDTGSIIFRVTPDGRHIAQIAEEGWLDCKTPRLKANGGPFLQNTSPPEPIKADGTFGGTERYDSTRELLPGTIAHITSSVTGKFGAATAGGTWELRATVVDRKTRKVRDTCSRRVTWKKSQ
jgi:hypothetical protein